ncbi:MAG: sodium:proton antiporter NhaD [Gammaproteobacteria bacterium]|nr:sodium:proton antiporter NhaD [Gammaproteobacteria bacterium]
MAGVGSNASNWLDLTVHPVGYISIILFIIAYLLVMCEECTQLRKSKPVILVAGIIWALIAYQYSVNGLDDMAINAFRHNLLEFAELFLFLLVAMTYVNALDERQVFMSLRSWLVHKGCSYKLLFWVTGALSFILSPVIDNLTTALVMSAVVLAVGKDDSRFVSLAFVNIVVAANAGGAFSPFGDITTLMVWQKGMVEFQTFFLLFVPALVNFMVPAALMHFFVPQGVPEPLNGRIRMRRGAYVIMFLFACTIATSVGFHSLLHMPPMLGMMTGLAYLQFYGYYLKKTHIETPDDAPDYGTVDDVLYASPKVRPAFDVFGRLARAEWDTLLFFYGVVLCVGGLGFIGYLALLSQHFYLELGATTANVMVGFLSAVIDNIPVMFAVLSMQPDMSLGQWLLVTLTAGVGGSMLSIGSAAGVALMGQARGLYTFFTHLKWTPVIALGYVGSILVHIWLNAATFQIPVSGG